MTRLFNLRFKNRTILFYDGDLPKNNGITDFSQKHRIKHLKRYHPELLPEYERHLRNFDLRFKLINDLIKKGNRIEKKRTTDKLLMNY